MILINSNTVLQGKELKMSLQIIVHTGIIWTFNNFVSEKISWQKQHVVKSVNIDKVLKELKQLHLLEGLHNCFKDSQL